MVCSGSFGVFFMSKPDSDKILPVYNNILNTFIKHSKSNHFDKIKTFVCLKYPIT